MRQRRASHLRLAGENEAPRVATSVDARALTHTSRRGVAWFLHQGTTKRGKPKYYVAKSVGAGALAEMPPGFEFSESVNGVVSVRRVDESPKLVPDADVELVRCELARQRHLRHHRVEATRAEIVIYEPAGAMSDDSLRETARAFGLPIGLFERRTAEMWTGGRYQPVMRFLASSESGQYVVERTTYRGEGGWSYPLAHGPLTSLVTRFVPVVGTDRFFELF